MPKHKSPYCSIASLKGLEYMYAQLRSIPYDQISEKKYAYELQKSLFNDNVGVGEKSRNFISKYRGLPIEASSDDVTGIETTILDEIVKKVYKELGLEKLFPEIGDMDNQDYPYLTFERIIFPSPEFFAPLSAAKYYKYLNGEQRKLVDGFVSRRLSELGLGAGSITTYCAYVWNDRDKSVHMSILQIDRSTKLATFSYYQEQGKNFVAKTVLRSDLVGKSEDGYALENNTLYLTLKEENSALSFIRMNIEIAIRDQEFFNMPFLRSTYSTSTENASHPASGVMAFEKKASFFEALETVKHKERWNKHLCFDVMTLRDVVKEQSLFEPGRFTSYLGHQVVRLVAGAYRFAFVSQISARNPKGNIVMGNCFIQKDGLVFFQSNGSLITKAYIENKSYLGSEGLCIAVFSPEGADAYKMHYQLKIEPDFDEKGERRANRLLGTFAGLVRGMATSADVVFFRKPTISTFEELTEKFQPSSFDPNDEKILAKLTQEQKDFRTELKRMQDERPFIL